jgi:lysophospholipid acyltransferase (LPLAT)-like uncharacterized protein
MTMRLLLSLFLFAGVSRMAAAHTLGNEDGVIVQLWHQMLGLHHFPLTALLIVAGILLFRSWRKASRM